jgi:CubicO group peptidase (beta-lactamase class C family)
MEKVTGERFDRLMQRLVLSPLGMKGGFNPAEMSKEQVENIATLYQKSRTEGDKEIWNPQGPWIAQVDDYSTQPPVNRAPPGYVIGSNGALFGPQGNLRASAADLARVMRMLLAHGVIEGRRFLQPQTVEAMFARVWKYRDEADGEATLGSQHGIFQAWGLGNQQFIDASAAGSGDRLVEGGGFTAVGHLGDAYGLHGGFLMDRDGRRGIIYLAGGTSFDPDTDTGQYSGLHRYEERIITAIYRRALLDRAD